MSGEAIDAAGVLPGKRVRGASARRKTKNDLLRWARLTQRSASGSGMAMSRRELAEAVNAHIYATSGRMVALDSNHVGKMERGEIRWPTAQYRAALCAVLGAARSADLGFYIIREGVDPNPPESEPGSDVTLPAMATGPEVATGPAVVEVSVNAGAGAAVTVMCSDGAPGRVSVVAGAVRVLIDTSGTDAAGSPWGAVGTPMVEGGARVYSLAQRRAR